MIDPIEDELACLNLNITVPRSYLEGNGSARKLPVLVFIHGGGLACGSSSMLVGGRQLFDATNLVRSSVEMGTGIVCVTINYRIGTLGFLASSELKRFNESFSEPYGNYGLHDQRQALKWIRRYINGFGGATDNVTIHGTSAGAVSCDYQMKFPNRDFQRAILSSGTIETLAPRSTGVQQSTFDHCVTIAGCRPNDADPLGTLLSLPQKEIAVSLPGLIVHPVIDGVWITDSFWNHRPDGDTATDVMVGACAWEREFGNVFITRFPSSEPRSDAEILDQAKELFSDSPVVSDPITYPSSNSDVVSRYRLGKSIDLPSKAANQWAQLLTDLLFWVPTLRIATNTANTNGQNILLYTFDAVNPFPAAASYGVANHGVNDLYLFNVAQDHVPGDRLEAWSQGVTAVQTAWVNFCYGGIPWEPVRQVRTEIALCGPIYSFNNKTGGCCFDTIGEAVGRELAGQWSALME